MNYGSRILWTSLTHAEAAAVLLLMEASRQLAPSENFRASWLSYRTESNYAAQDDAFEKWDLTAHFQLSDCLLHILVHKQIIRAVARSVSMK